MDNLKKSFNTGIPDYETFKAIFNLFAPVVDNLVYFDSNTNAEGG